MKERERRTCRILTQSPSFMSYPKFTKEFEILSFLKEFEILILKLIKIPEQNTKISISFRVRLDKEF